MSCVKTRHSICALTVAMDAFTKKVKKKNFGLWRSSGRCRSTV